MSRRGRAALNMMNALTARPSRRSTGRATGRGGAPVAHEWDYQRKPTRVGLQSELPGLRLTGRNGPLVARGG